LSISLGRPPPGARTHPVTSTPSSIWPADPAPGQVLTSDGPTPLATHKLTTYLRDPSESRTQIGQQFAELSDYVSGLPGRSGAPCDTTSTTPATEAPTADTTPSTDTTDTTDTTPPSDTATSDTTPGTDTTPSSDTTPTSTAADQTFSGGFIPPDPNNNPAHVTFLTNTIQITVHADGSADGTYSIAYTQNDTYLSPDILPDCVETFTASGTLKLTADGGGTGTIENLSEATPTAAGCWPGWTATLRSRGGWRLNSLDGGRAQGGVDVYGQGLGFNLAAG
jgi:hypothetical protein